jgi:hypothetical protein
MQTSELQWTSFEQSIAKAAIDNAHQREIEALVRVVRDQASSITSTDAVWQLHDFLSARRHELDGKYDDREAASVFTLASLVKDGWLTLGELAGLTQDKLAKISALTRML